MLTLFALTAFAAPCDLEAPSDAPFRVTLPARAANVHLLLEIWATPNSVAWAEAMFAELTRSAVLATLVVPVDSIGPLGALAETVRESGHAVAVHLPTSAVPGDPVAGHRRVRSMLAPWRPIETTVIAGPSRVQEAVLGRAGVHEILRMEAAGNGSPALAAVFEGLPRTNVVLSAGPYSGSCGLDPRVGPFTPLAADRAAQAIYGASGAPFATVRVALDGARGGPADSAVLLRWLETVTRPAGIVTTTAPLVRMAARAAVREGDPAGGSTIGRLVPVEVVVQAAEALRSPGAELPRALPGPLNLTEAFEAFLLLSTDAEEGDVVRLHPLGGPIARAVSTLPGPVSVSASSVRAVAEAILKDAPDALPSAIPCDGRLLTAAELLLALAALVRGEDPVRIPPIEVPEPNAPGLGWGAAGLP